MNGLNLGIGLGPSFGGGNASGSQWIATSGAPLISLLPSGIVSGGNDGDAITRWQHVIAGQAAATIASGTPTLYLTDTVPGVLFNNADQLITGVCSGVVDDDLTIFIVMKETGADVAVQYVFQLSATGGAGVDDIMPVIDRYPGAYWRARRPYADNVGTAQFAEATPATVPHVYRFDCTTDDGTLYRDGKYVGSSAAKIISANHTGVLFGIGASFAGAHPFGGVVYAVLVYRRMAESEKLRIDALLRDMFSLPAPYLGPTGPVLNPSDPPRYLLAPRIYTLPDEPVEIYKDVLQLYDGDAAVAFTCTDAPFAPGYPADRRVLKLASGTAHVTVQGALGTSAATAVEVVPEPSIGATPITVLWCGDSNGARNEAIERLKNRWGSRIVFIGDQGPEAGYSSKYASRDATTFHTFNSSGSPFWNGGSGFDVAGYITSIGGVPPTDMPWIMGHNAVNGIPYGSVDAAMAADLADAEAIIAAWKAAVPGIRFYFINYWRENGEDDFFPTHDLWWQQQKNDHRMGELMTAQFAGREAEGIYLIGTNHGMSFANFRDDVVHLNKGPGGHALARIMGAALAKFAFT